MSDWYEHWINREPREQVHREQASRVPPLRHLAEDAIMDHATSTNPFQANIARPGSKETPITRRRKKKHVVHVPLSDEDISRLIHMAMNSHD